MRRCVFCDTPIGRGELGNKADEHLIGKWLQKRLGINEERVESFSADYVTGERQASRTHTLMTVIAKDVCKDCNEGWMSDLEQAVAPIFERFLAKSTRVWQCSSEEQESLRTWAYKTALVAVAASPLKDKQVPVGHYRLMAERQEAPSNVYVIVNHVGADYKRVAFLLAGKLSVVNTPGGELPPVEGMGNSYIFSLQVGNTMLTCVYCEAPKHVIALQAEHYFPLARPLSDFAWYRSTTPSLVYYKDQIKLLEAAARSVVIMSQWPHGVDVLTMKEGGMEFEFIPTPKITE